MRILHTCGGPKWGKLASVGLCPRCDELRAGAPVRPAWIDRYRKADVARANDIRNHFEGEKHRSGGCGPVCTYGEW